MDEAVDVLKDKGFSFDRLRIRSFPFDRKLERFIDDHKYVFILEQNRDAQMRAMIATELEKDFSKLQSILNFDGNPVTADFIVEEFIGKVKEDESLSRLIKKTKSAA